jgi:hypothetical protein
MKQKGMSNEYHRDKKSLKINNRRPRKTYTNPDTLKESPMLIKIDNWLDLVFEEEDLDVKTLEIGYVIERHEDEHNYNIQWIKTEAPNEWGSVERLIQENDINGWFKYRSMKTNLTYIRVYEKKNSIFLKRVNEEQVITDPICELLKLTKNKLREIKKEWNSLRTLLMMLSLTLIVSLISSNVEIMEVAWASQILKLKTKD